MVEKKTKKMPTHEQLEKQWSKRQAYLKKYLSSPVVKAKRKAYLQAYFQRDEVKAHRKQYLVRYLADPRVQEARLAYQKEYAERMKKARKLLQAQESKEKK